MNSTWDIRYIPEDLFYGWIEPQLNRLSLAHAFHDKNSYFRHFIDLPEPIAILRCISGHFYAGNDEVSAVEAAEILRELGDAPCIVKPSLDSGGGRNVALLSDVLPEPDGRLTHLLGLYGDNFIIQQLVRQHLDIAEPHPSSLNTVRFLTVRLSRAPTVASAVIRFGNNGSLLDNQNSGGISCGISADGMMKEFAFDSRGVRYSRHPTTGVSFLGRKIPNFELAVDLVTRLHRSLDHFGLVSWDVAFDQAGKPLILELNLKFQGINLHQFSNGPLFGPRTDEILELIAPHP